MAQRPAVPELASISFMAPMILSVPGDVIGAAGSVVTCLLLLSALQIARLAIADAAAEKNLLLKSNWSGASLGGKASEHSSGGLSCKWQPVAAGLIATSTRMLNVASLNANSTRQICNDAS